MTLSNSLLEDVLNQARQELGKGKVADYIPALAEVQPNQLGIAIQTVAGESFFAGDANTPFSIQSISKVLSLTLASCLYNAEEIHARVGIEPSGQAFNSLVQLEFEQGKPRNPFINAGALVISDLLQSRLSAPKHRLLELVRELADNPHIVSDKVVASSEFAHSARNAAIAYLMKDYGNFSGKVETVLQTYFHACALRMSCLDLARTFIYLANQGKTHKGKTLISQKRSKQINALLATCGLYDEAGEFAFRVGMPGKSGVGGGIVAIIPGEMSIAVWSPELNPNGNSLAGIRTLELLAEQLGRSIF